MIEPTYNYPLDSDNTAKRKAKNVDTTSQNTAEASNMPGLGAMEKARVWINMAGAEETGIERITDEMRSEQKPRDLFTLFFSGNVNTATLALGYLGPTVYGMGWWDSFLTILFFNLVGCIFPSAVAVFGPKLGLRTMIIPRYSFGWWPAKVLAFLNVVNQIGWAVVNCISGSSVLYDVGDGRLPLAVAVFLIGTLASILSCLGYKVLHFYDRYSWIAMMICFIIVAGFGAREFINQPIRAGSAEASSVLSFGTAIIGFQVAWLPAAADYGVYMREDISIWTTFGFTYGGLITSQLFIEFLGAAVGTLAYSTNTVFLNAYDQRGMGGMIGVLFDSYGTGARGFGKLVEALLSFSTCAVIGTGIYSMGLSVQMISKKWLVVPRLVWSAGGSIAFLVCAIVGRNDLETVMSNFLSICAYWIVPFSTVVLLEHFIWRRHFDYDLDAWNDRMSLPYGISATIAFIVGTATALLAMSQTWWIGPIAKSIGNTESGTDISWMLAFSISSILFIPLRHFERKIFVH